jgi:hypothetical protein
MVSTPPPRGRQCVCVCLQVCLRVCEGASAACHFACKCMFACWSYYYTTTAAADAAAATTTNNNNKLLIQLMLLRLRPQAKSCSRARTLRWRAMTASSWAARSRFSLTRPWRVTMRNPACRRCLENTTRYVCVCVRVFACTCVMSLCACACLRQGAFGWENSGTTNHDHAKAHRHS